MQRADMSIWIHFVVLLVQSLTNADGVLYVSEGNVSLDEASSSCNLATPEIHFGIEWNTVSLDDADLNMADGESVWSGYVQTYAAFLYEGCFEQNPSNNPVSHSNMPSDPGQCYSKCNTTVIGMQSTTCHCIPSPEKAKQFASGCNITCSNPVGTVCGGNEAVSIYRKVTYPVSGDGGVEAEDKNCRALFWKRHGENYYSWRECWKKYVVMCGNGYSSLEFDFYRGTANWRRAAEHCLSNDKIPAVELSSGFPNLRGLGNYNNLIWTGQIRSRVIGKDVDSNRSEPGWRRGLITKSGGKFVLRFSTSHTSINSLCENVLTSTPGDLRTSTEQNSTPDDDPQYTMTSTSAKPDDEPQVSTISTSTPGDLRTSTEQNTMPDDDPQSTMKSTSAHEEYRNSSEQNARLDDDQQFPMIAVYTAVPAVLVLVAVVVIVIICKLRKRTVRKQDDQAIRQDNNHSGRGIINAVSNESYQHGDVRHDNLILEHEYDVVDDADINVAIDTEYDTTTNLNKSSNDTDNVYNKLESLSDDTYNHTNTAAASVDDIYDKATFDEHDSTYNTTNTLPGSRIGHVIDTDGVYNKLESLSDDTYNHTNAAAASVDDTYDKATFDEQDSTYNTTNTLPGYSIGHVIDTDGVYSKVNI